MADKPKYYWDACAWIGLIKQEPDKYDSLKYTIELAQKKEVTIWTSTFTLAEVFKRKCNTTITGLDPANDQQFEDFLTQDYIIKVQVDSDIGIAARRLLRAHSVIGKPQDAVHLATALLNNIDEMHTLDMSNLLPLDGVIERLDGKKLKICRPPSPPDPNKGTLFEKKEPEPADSGKAAAETKG